ncbi:hypothetical protein HanRHA438_Chr08g0335051 [Helianthus annuus]|uniref:Uncharacterized protein n=1 Tax=Helianthus annuus TaxID=4232 RepID=A0A251U3A6_HELAN|nr:hypothetical protein HanXRQr2_Chr08g0323891 [Helianthus annuus]KAJ0433613.1 hypothetical protein HanIR_Chr17g0872221 [Helianthus annuus]KAJ0826420.1 hypothetical protein HanRHA438_Chr17g0814111 [Helianthus annuus]KAJ0896472.1 hypothetical protein HanRHA438_Chr08g0335051 [Helianthus annuus]
MVMSGFVTSHQIDDYLESTLFVSSSLSISHRSAAVVCDWCNCLVIYHVCLSVRNCYR